MRVRSKFVLASACAAAIVAVVVPTASAGAKTECKSTYSNTKLNGGVVVNQGDVCILNNVTVNGGLTVNGGALAFLAVDNSTIHGGWSMTGTVIPINIFAGSPSDGYFCANNVDGGLNVSGVETFGNPLSFGEANAGCAGGTINGGASFTNNDSGGVEVDAYTVNGGLTFANDTGFNELEKTTVNGSASCDVASDVQNDQSGPGSNANSYTGQNNGCPA